MGDEEYAKSRYVNGLYDETLSAIERMIGHNGSTTTDELDMLGSHLFGENWRGAVPKDKPPHLRNCDVCIINTDVSTGDGEHWLALGKHKNQTLGYDSFGRMLGGGITDSELDPEQFIQEKNCGQRCLAWLVIFKKLGCACLHI